ncbi:hypothetical protein IEO21_09862 [Rhodonia placenta]|uniref:DUF6533 domain-containing protein n=1 Tax=Rhodonia placenta TaxID=104341 RepID=A0A8H7TXU7_9APHY|nr:hypothetical protein IEO21_09862 [Postia placenta]
MFVNAALADARLGLFVYDSIISFNLEWRAVWSRKITGATAIYLALRYVTLANVVTYVITDTVTSCEVLSVGHILPRQYAGSQTSLTYIAQFCTMRFSMSASKYNIGSLTTVLFRDGYYNRLVVGLNAANIVVALLQEVSHTLELPTYRIGTVVLCRFFLNLRHFFSGPDVSNSNMSSHASSFSSFASSIIGNLGKMLEDDPLAPDDDFEGELDGLNDAEDVDGPVELSGSAKAFSDADKAQAQMATMAVFKQKTDEGDTANHELPEATDEGFNQRAIDIVVHMLSFPSIAMYKSSLPRCSCLLLAATQIHNYPHS